MRFVMTCLKCGNEIKSPEGRDPVTFKDFQLLIKEMGLVCRKCGGEVVGSEEGRCMECRFRALLRCPTCLRVFCVPDLAGSSVIWHRFCESACDRIPCSDAAEHADRAGLKYDGDHNRLVIDVEGQ